MSSVLFKSWRMQICGNNKVLFYLRTLGLSFFKKSVANRSSFRDSNVVQMGCSIEKNHYWCKIERSFEKSPLSSWNERGRWTGLRPWKLLPPTPTIPIFRNYLFICSFEHNFYVMEYYRWLKNVCFSSSLTWNAVERKKCLSGKIVCREDVVIEYRKPDESVGTHALRHRRRTGTMGIDLQLRDQL